MPHTDRDITELIRRLVHAWCVEHNTNSAQRVDLTAGDDAPLFGVERVLDSIALVGLLVAVEQGLDDTLGVSLTLADEKAASQARSPFRTIGSLVAYASERTRQELGADG